jgi:hypothetical protein
MMNLTHTGKRVVVVCGCEGSDWMWGTVELLMSSAKIRGKKEESRAAW